MKSGLQYGADYVLYAAHPAHAHSEFCVLLMRSGGGVDDASEFSWNDLEIANRLINQVTPSCICLSDVSGFGGWKGAQVPGGSRYSDSTCTCVEM